MRYSTCQYVSHLCKKNEDGKLQICLTVRDLETLEDVHVWMDLTGEFSKYTGDSLAALGWDGDSPSLVKGENKSLGTLIATLRVKPWSKGDKSGFNYSIFPMKTREIAPEDHDDFLTAFASLDFEPVPVTDSNRAGSLPAAAIPNASSSSGGAVEDELPF